MVESKASNYWDYICVEDFLSLQGGLEVDESSLSNDEVVFIMVYQVYEFWFKLILRELCLTWDIFKVEVVDEQCMSDVVCSIQRIVVLLCCCADYFQVMEMLTTRSYLLFCDKLMLASGFQSAQMRQIEIFMGLRDEERIPFGVGGDYKQAFCAHDGSVFVVSMRVEGQQQDGPTFARAVVDWFYRTPIDGVGFDDEGDEAAFGRFVEVYCAVQSGEVDRTCALALERAMEVEDWGKFEAWYEDEKLVFRGWLEPIEEEGGVCCRCIRAAMVFILTYRELPLLAWFCELFDGLIELEQVFVIFRQRHVRMVERVIGRRTGTGGSSGVDYLDATSSYCVFRDFWAVRIFQIRAEAAPELSNPGFYAFRNG